MKRYLAVAFLMVVLGSARADDTTTYDGSSSVKYAGRHRIMRNQSTTVRGFVDLNGGFTACTDFSRGAEVLMDTNVSVSGVIDLRGTNTLTLLRNLYLDGGVTLSSGRIKGFGNALVMNGDLNIPADAVVHCGGNLIIDGNGNTLRMGSSSQIFLDNSSTLTLRNMVIETGHTYPGQPALNISSSMSKLALDNVVLSLGDDLHIPRGQLFFHNDVVVTGTSALVYRSIAPSYIASHGTLMFDHGTTFSYAPATNNKDLIVLSDASATLALNGCSLKATHTGLRLTKGRLYLDDKVTLDSAAVNKLESITTVTVLNYGYRINSIAWSPDGKYMAVGGWRPNNGKDLQIYGFNGSILTELDSKAYSDNPVYYNDTEGILSLAWSPDGKYIAIGGTYASSTGGFSNTNALRIYSFDGQSLSPVTSFGDMWHAVCSLAWSPDGKHIAVGCKNSSGNTELLRVYSFDGKTILQKASQDYGQTIFSVAWSPDGRFIALGGEAPEEVGGFPADDRLRVYCFNGSSLLPVTSKSGTGTIYSVSWLPDGNFIVVGTLSNQSEVKLYAFNGTSLEDKSHWVDYASYCYSVACSPDAKYFAVGFNDSSVKDEFAVYSFSGNAISESFLTSYNYGAEVRSVAWSFDNKYIAAAGRSSSGCELWIGRCLFKNETATQVLSNGIVFGNRELGSTHDLDVHVLAGAQVAVTGKVFHDPA